MFLKLDPSNKLKVLHNILASANLIIFNQVPHIYGLEILNEWNIPLKGFLEKVDTTASSRSADLRMYEVDVTKT